jgi:hypothetical protein
MLNRKASMTNTIEPNLTIAIYTHHQNRLMSNPIKQRTLTYNIGCDDNKAINFHVVANSGNGFFNKDKLSLSDIQACSNS